MAQLQTTEEQPISISHYAEKRLENDVQRDAARTRESMSYDDVEHVEEDAELANEATDAQMKNAY